MSYPVKSLRAFNQHLIDYAGLFPPASLDLRPAIENHARYAKGADRWMLSRFIIPIRRLSALSAEMMALFSPQSPLHLSLISRDLTADLPILNTFRAQYADRITVGLLETRFPTDGAFSAIIEQNARLSQAADLNWTIFYELPFDDQWDKQLENAIEAVSQHSTGVGFKLRCGGVEPHMFPSPEQVARAILLCRDYGVLLKCTAGLHHPIRHFNAEVGTMMHGFINVFGGLILAKVWGLDSAELLPILTDENPNHFTFTDEHFAWCDLTATVDDINSARQTALLSYGSCSFDEPREDLQALKLL